MTDPTGKEPEKCGSCNAYLEDHDFEHLARYCYPPRIDQLLRDRAELVGALEKFKKWEDHVQLGDKTQYELLDLKVNALAEMEEVLARIKGEK